jgi:hypothetical protein
MASLCREGFQRSKAMVLGKKVRAECSPTPRTRFSTPHWLKVVFENSREERHRSRRRDDAKGGGGKNFLSRSHGEHGGGATGRQS